MNPTSSLELRVLRRDDDLGQRDEVVVLVDGAERLALLGRDGASWIGLAPARLFGADAPLVATEEPHDAFIARCDCGEEGCGALVARIRRVGATVVWDQFRRGSAARPRTQPIDAEAVVFDADAYDTAVAAGADAPATSTWAPTTRRAARMARARLDGVDLEPLRLGGGGFGHRGDEEIVFVALLGTKGDSDYCYLTAPFRLREDESAEALAERSVFAVRNGSILRDPAVHRRPLDRPPTDPAP